MATKSSISDKEKPDITREYGPFYCQRCKQMVRNIKYFNHKRKLCQHCYEFMFTQIPCRDCFTKVDVKSWADPKELKRPFLCPTCLSQQKRIEITGAYTRIMAQDQCLRNQFQCQECANLHSQRCPLIHYADMNTPSYIQAEKQNHVNQYMPSQCQNGYYFWHKLLFCSRECVRKQFGQSPFCVVCGDLQTVRCLDCHVPVCGDCSKRWLVDGRCMQCSIDKHPDWSQKDLHRYFADRLQTNYPQILNDPTLSANLKWIIVEYLIRRY